MPRVVLANAFSLRMLQTSSTETILRVKEVGIEEVKELLAGGYESAIGHVLGGRPMGLRGPSSRGVGSRDRGRIASLPQGDRTEMGEMKEVLKKIALRWGEE
jgi:hypothetical protein